MNGLPISSTVGILATLTGVCAFFFWLERVRKWKVFRYFPSLVFIYLVPVVLTNTGMLASDAPVYEALKQLILPMLLVLLMLNVSVGGAFRVMGRGIGVMLFGTLGVMVGAPIGMLAVKPWLGPDAWKGFGTLAGSWIGGTGNLAAVAEMLDTPGTEFGLAVLADSTMYAIWLPILLGSKHLADRFADFTGVEAGRVARMEQAAEAEHAPRRAPAIHDYLFLWFVGFAATWLADAVSCRLPQVEPFLLESTWRILLITTFGISLSFTPLRRVPGSHELGMALVYLFVASMGASAQLQGVAEQAIPFLLGATLMIVIHGAFCVLGARLFRTDLYTAAIASAANVGGAASATIVASNHRESLVPAAVLMALMGYSLGNYCAYVAALACRLLS